MGQLRFDGRSVVVTGGGRGVGREHALLLGARGADVVVADLGGRLDGSGSSSEPADQVVKEIEAAGGRAVACCASVADEAGAEAIVRTALEAFGRLDVVVNNAGIAEPDWFEDLGMERFRRMVDVHYLGTVQVTKAAWPHLVAGGYGRVVNTCSEAAFGITPKNTSYGGAKGGVFGFTRSLAVDAARHGILVNAVAPRAATRLSDPDVLAHVYDAPAERFKTSMARFGPERAAPVVGYLAHESCRLNGEVLVAGGGQVLRLAVIETKGVTAEDLTPEVVAEHLDEILDPADAVLVGVGAHPSPS